MLYLHPRIQKAAGEVHFFDRDENYWRGLEWYRKKMPHSFKGQITIEKSPSYFVSPEVSLLAFDIILLLLTVADIPFVNVPLLIRDQKRKLNIIFCNNKSATNIKRL